MEKFFKKSSHNFKELLEEDIKKIKKIPLILGRNIFLCILILILIDILIGGFLFYKYVILIDTKELKIISVYNKFKENTYWSVLKEWEKRENISINLLLSDKSYIDPFK